MYEIFTDKDKAKKVTFGEMIDIPKKQRSSKVRNKTFTTHLLSSDENMAKIFKADTQTKRKEEIKKKRQNALKVVLADEKRKRKCTDRKDSVKAHQLPTVKRKSGPKL